MVCACACECVCACAFVHVCVRVHVQVNVCVHVRVHAHVLPLSICQSCSRIIATFMAHTVENREKVWNVRSVKYRSFSASRRRQEDLHEAHGMICKHCFTTGNWAHGRVHVFISKLKNETVSQKPGNRRASEK